MEIISEYKPLSGLEVNISKTEIASNGQVPTGYVVSETLDILGIPIWAKNPQVGSLHEQLRNIADDSSHYCNRSMSFRARALNIETFIYSQLIHKMRHLRIQKHFIKSLNSRIVDQFWLSRKHNVHIDVLSTNVSNCGIGLKKLDLLTISAKIMNLKYLAFQQKENEFSDQLKSSKFFRQIIRKEIVIGSCVQELSFEHNSLKIKINGIEINICKDTKSKAVHGLLLKAQKSNEALIRLNKTAVKLQTNPNNLVNVCKNLWANTRLCAFDKNIIYCFLMNSY